MEDLSNKKERFIQLRCSDFSNEQSIYLNVTKNIYDEIEKSIMNKQDIEINVHTFKLNKRKHDENIRDLIQVKNIASVYEKDNFPFEFKENKTSRGYKETILNNLSKALEKRGFKEMLQRLQEKFGYKNPNGIYKVLGGKSGNIKAQDILMLEELGIHRDEILGDPIAPFDSLKNRRSIRRLAKIYNTNEDARNEINSALKALVDLLEKDSLDETIIAANRIKETLNNIS
ncbi:hypothetical protein BK139_05090 [Paenibacillus sp. FSL R5-0490]|uniref:hypothetical protein n=1 Tax=Bacillales TaxID=1385 RepID=UPI00096F847A|nr:hypothetical protein [Paenibacillus sp. FSL R5-0490]OMF61703.1 hypothetical protein BK139_05090 [Paenibacillus sp. FSL R5-0490]